MTQYNDTNNLSGQISSLQRQINELRTQPRLISSSIDRGGTQSSDYNGTDINNRGTTGWFIGTDETTGVGYAVFNSTTDTPWTLYTPVLTGGTTNPVLGVGGSATGKYKQLGKTVFAQGNITFGSGMSPGSGLYRLSTPIAPVLTGGSPGFTNGTAMLFDASASTIAVAVAYALNSVGFAFRSHNNLDTSESIPWVWSAGDQIRWSITYEVA